MSLFRSLLDSVVTKFGPADSIRGQVAQAVLKRLDSNEGGGLSGLIQQLQSQGLGEKVKSWIGNGSNIPISPEQIESVLGSEWVQKLAARTGISPDVIRNHLSEILPKVVDHMTPNGQIPKGEVPEEELPEEKAPEEEPTES